MARPDLRHPANADGAWFVDERCIDCGTCRDLAPDVFVDIGDRSVVASQPSPSEEGQAWLAAQACPTQSIGTTDRSRPRPGPLYPHELAPGLFDLGYCSPDSFGASSYLLVREGGAESCMVDSPRYAEGLARRIEALGGVAHVLLTHRDDVADADRWAERFGARVWIHADDRSAAKYATDHFEGEGEVEVVPGVVAVPVPGHTKGSVVFVADDRHLLTGDSLAWSHATDDLTAFRRACWYSWEVQTESLRRLATSPHRFERVLPGHGARVDADPDELHERLVALVGRM